MFFKCTKLILQYSLFLKTPHFPSTPPPTFNLLCPCSFPFLFLGRQTLATARQKMEVEVKLKLTDSLSHQKLNSLLSPFHTKTLLQENLFFDTPTSDLASNLAALRLRFYNHDRCVLSLKSKPSISDGVSRVEEIEHDIEPTLGRACTGEPWRIGSIPPNRVLDRASEIIEDLGKLVCLGGFKNVRNVYKWKGLTLEIDETVYEFGTSYEVECESGSESVDEAKRLIEELLREHGIGFSYSPVSKFAVFMSGKLPP
ncbi:hypothetical protein Ancab_012069 [Ancistrocladus abbreviatus]